MSEAPLTEQQRRLLWEFEGWLMQNKVGMPNDGRSIPIPQDFDDTMIL